MKKSKTHRQKITFKSLDAQIVKYIEGLAEEDRLDRIDDLLHRLNFERRLAAN